MGRGPGGDEADAASAERVWDRRSRNSSRFSARDTDRANVVSKTSLTVPTDVCQTLYVEYDITD